MSKLDRLIAARERMDEQIAKIASLPSEPEAEDGDYPVIAWTMRFGNASVTAAPRGELSYGTLYTYAACRADNGLWYTTGPRAPKGYAWDDLIEWITSNSAQGTDTPVYLAVDWEAL